MYRAGMESILGFKLRGNRLKIDPCIPRWWREYEITYRRGRTTYYIKVENPHSFSRGIATIQLEGALQSDEEIHLLDDGQTHSVRIVLGEKPAKVQAEEPAPETREEQTRNSP
jgi:cyclic beta-1,2-glucan synthetase